MKTALLIYILLGVLSIVPLIAFNIRKIWVKRPPDPVRFKPVRFGVILVLCLFLGTFLTVSYQMTMKSGTTVKMAIQTRYGPASQREDLDLSMDHTSERFMI